MNIIFISSKFQTKNWRFNNICNKKGQKNNKAEIYQRKNIEIITNQICKKTNGLRINWRKNIIKVNKTPFKSNDCFDWTEDFDGIQYFNNAEIVLLYNFKFVCDKGGAQNRTLRDTCKFIESQLKFINNNIDTKYVFINILDGDECYNNKNKFNYILNLDEYKNAKKKCLVLDSYEFKNYFISEFNK